MALPARWKENIKSSDSADEIMELQMGPSHPAAHGTIKFNWAMEPVSGGMVQTVGFDFFVLDECDRIRADYQFIER